MSSDAPVHIVPYDPEWPRQFAAERDVLSRAIGRWLAGPIEHIGSTAIPGLAAKPVIDMMAGVESLESSRGALNVLEHHQYCYAPYRTEVMHWLCKPSPAHRTHHLHLVPIGSPLWREQLSFRDYLVTHADVAHEYAVLKRALAETHRFDREAYTTAKTPFVQRIIRTAMARLDRFTRAQADPHAGFDAALAEIRSGRKQGHWIWYVFPQLAGLGVSRASQDYAIADLAEAVEYLRHPVLSARFLTIASAVAEQLRAGVSVEDLMNASIDARKLVSSLTLFEAAGRTLESLGETGQATATVALAHEILAVAETEGYSRCPLTLRRISESA